RYRFFLSLLVLCSTLHSIPSFFFLMLRPPPSSTLFPYTTLFRSSELNLFFILCSLKFVAAPLSPCHLLILVQQINFPVGLHMPRSEEHTSELQSRFDLVCRLLLEKKKCKHNLFFLVVDQLFVEN